MNALRLAFCALILSALACRPVIAIGWGELLILLFLFLCLFGLSMWRFWQKWQALYNRREKD